MNNDVLIKMFFKKSDFHLFIKWGNLIWYGCFCKFVFYLHYIRFGNLIEAIFKNKGAKTSGEFKYPLTSNVLHMLGFFVCLFLHNEFIYSICSVLCCYILIPQK